MSFSSLKKVTAAYDLTSDGFLSSKNRFVDQSGNKRHMPVFEGTPSFITRDGHECLTGTQGSAFQAYVKNPIPIYGAIIAVFHTNITGADGVRYLLTADSLDTPSGQHGTPIEQDGTIGDEYDESNAGNHQRYIMTYIGQCRHGLINGAVATQNYNQNEWNVVVCGLGRDGKFYTAVNGAPFTVSAEPANYRFDSAVEGLIGFMGNQDAPNNGGHSDPALITFIRDDLRVNQTSAVNDYVAGLMTKYGIT